MDSARIILRCVFAAVIYGVLLCEITAHLCLEYFTVYLPPLFGRTSPTLIGLLWGIIATWWVGGIMGILIAMAAQLGPRKLAAAQVVPLIHGLFVIIAACAVVSGALGYKNGVVPHEYHDFISLAMRHPFMADMYANTASIVSAIAGTLVLCLVVVLKRLFAGRRAAH